DWLRHTRQVEVQHADRRHQFRIFGGIQQRIRRPGIKKKRPCQQVRWIDEEAGTLELANENLPITVKRHSFLGVLILPSIAANTFLIAKRLSPGAIGPDVLTDDQPHATARLSGNSGRHILYLFKLVNPLFEPGND